MKLNKKFSIIIPTYNGEKTITKLVNELLFAFRNHEKEIVIVNDNSPDKTHYLCLKISRKFKNYVTYIKLSKNFGEHNAVMAGLRYCTGDIAIIMDDDFQNRPNEALKLGEFTLRNNFDVVYTKYKKKNDSLIRNFMSNIANRTANLVLEKPRNIYLSSFKSIKRDIVNEIIKYEGPYPYIDGLIFSITNSVGSLQVLHDKRLEGISGYNLSKLLNHYVNLFTNFSTAPLRFFSIVGIFTIIISFFLILYTIYEKIFNPALPQGFTQIIIIVLFFSGLQILILGILGEYAGKILLNINKKNQYTVEFINKSKKSQKLNR